MAKKKLDKFEDAFFDFDNEAVTKLEQIFDSIISSLKPETPAPETALEETPSSEEPTPSKKNNQNHYAGKENYYRSKLTQTLDDILQLEDNAVEITLANIDNLYKGTYIKDIAERYQVPEAEVRERLRLELATQLRHRGMKCTNKRHYALHREIKHIIRMDFYGSVNNVKDKAKLSFNYKRRNPEDTLFASPDEYDLSKSPTWMIFRQFRSFRLMEKELPQMLIDEGVSPYDFARLNAYDFSQILYNRFIKTSAPGAKDKERANLFLGAKNRFVKAFIRKNKSALRDYMEFKGVDPRYTKALIKHMEAYGTTSGFDVVEENYTPEMIKVLKHRKLIPEQTKAGDQITLKQIDFIKANGMLNEILARDENGNPVTGPTITVHHKTAVQDSGERTNFADVNLFKNLCLIVEPYHFIAHSLDRTATREEDGAEYYVSRIELRENVAFYGGFNEIFQIEQEFEQNRYNEYDSNALDTFQNKKYYFADDNSYWNPNPRKPRKEKKQQRNLKQQVKKLLSDEELENMQLFQVENSQHKKKKKKKKKKTHGDSGLAQRRKQKALAEEAKKQELLRQRKEALALRAAKKAARRALDETLNPPKPKGITVIQPTPKQDKENISPAAQAPMSQKKKKQKIKQEQSQIQIPILNPEQIISGIQQQSDIIEFVKKVVVSANDSSINHPSLLPSLTKQKKEAEFQKTNTYTKPVNENTQPNADATAKTNTQAPKNKSKKEKRNSETTATGTPTQTFNKFVGKQREDNQRRIEKLEQIKAETLAKYQAQKADMNAKLTAEEQQKIQKTVNYLIRQRNIRAQ